MISNYFLIPMRVCMASIAISPIIPANAIELLIQPDKVAEIQKTPILEQKASILEKSSLNMKEMFSPATVSPSKKIAPKEALAPVASDATVSSPKTINPVVKKQALKPNLKAETAPPKQKQISIVKEVLKKTNEIKLASPGKIIRTIPQKKEVSIPQKREKQQDFSFHSLPEQKSYDFPELDCLKHNVRFWKTVYEKTSIEEAIVHDKYDLRRVYAVVQLPQFFPYSISQKLNQDKVEQTKQHYSSVLKTLATKYVTQDTLSEEEIFVASLFSAKDRKPSFFLESVDNMRAQNGLREHFDAGVDRSLHYIPQISKILRDHNVPEDILFLPHVESSYNPNAGSKVGARGLWQIMPSTMKMLMGRGTEHKRTDPVISTKAAAKLLLQNYEKTKSWPLALTAYNHGVNGVLKAIDQIQSRDLCKIIEYYESPSFKFASSNFYAQFLAARDIAAKKYGNLKSKNKSNPELIKNIEFKKKP